MSWYVFRLRRNSYAAVGFSVLILAMMGYLTYRAVQGENGLIRLLQIESNEEFLVGEYRSLAQQRLTIQDKVDRLSETRLDIDLLDEQARLVLHMVSVNEIVLPQE